MASSTGNVIQIPLNTKPTRVGFEPAEIIILYTASPLEREIVRFYAGEESKEPRL